MCPCLQGFPSSESLQQLGKRLGHAVELIAARRTHSDLFCRVAVLIGPSTNMAIMLHNGHGDGSAEVDTPAGAAARASLSGSRRDGRSPIVRSRNSKSNIHSFSPLGGGGAAAAAGTTATGTGATPSASASARIAQRSRSEQTLSR